MGESYRKLGGKECFSKELTFYKEMSKNVNKETV